MRPDVYVPKHGVHLFDEYEFNKERSYVRLKYLFGLKENIRIDGDAYLNKLLKNGDITGDDYIAIKNAIEEYIKSDIEPKIKLEAIMTVSKHIELLKCGRVAFPEPAPKRKARILKYFK